MEKTFFIESMSQDQFYEHINSWFAQNRNIVVKRFYISEKTSFGLLVNKSNVQNITIIYDVDNNSNNLYGIAYYEKFALMKISMESMKNSWQRSNPNLDVVTYSYRHNARGQVGNLLMKGIGASNRNQIWIIYKAKGTPKTAVTPVETVEKPTVTATTAAQSPVPQDSVAPKKKFCSQCGKPLLADSKFCQNCGAKV